MCYAPSNVVMFIDPGEKYCGWGLLDLEYPTHLYQLGTDSPEMLLERLRAWLVYWVKGYRPEIRTVVVEEYRLYDAVNQTGSDMPVPRLIGRIEEICFTTGRSYLTQPTRCKKPGLAYAEHRGLYLAGKTQHEKDVEAHAGWFLRGLDVLNRQTVQSGA